MLVSQRIYIYKYNYIYIYLVETVENPTVARVLEKLPHWVESECWLRHSIRVAQTLHHSWQNCFTHVSSSKPWCPDGTHPIDGVWGFIPQVIW
jgi:hypothetical protein